MDPVTELASIASARKNSEAASKRAAESAASPSPGIALVEKSSADMRPADTMPVSAIAMVISMSVNPRCGAAPRFRAALGCCRAVGWIICSSPNP